MKLPDKNEFLKKSNRALDEIYEQLSALHEIAVKSLKAGKTVLLIVDMVNGFAREGSLSSPRVEGLIPEITKLSEMCDKAGITKIAFADCHTKASPEFDAYPEHCMEGTSEGEIVSEIKEAGGYLLIPKNSTNGFLEERFQAWLRENPEIDTFIVTGDCTDICILQFSTSLKAWFNIRDKRSRVIVPINTADTYDLGTHDAELMNITALYNMIGNGIEIVSKIV
jgi:nicotinamidase-related amidase